MDEEKNECYRRWLPPIYFLFETPLKDSVRNFEPIVTWSHRSELAVEDIAAARTHQESADDILSVSHLVEVATKLNTLYKKRNVKKIESSKLVIELAGRYARMLRRAAVIPDLTLTMILKLFPKRRRSGKCCVGGKLNTQIRKIVMAKPN